MKIIRTDNLTQLNNIMVDHLVMEGKITDLDVERAFRKVKRHLFLEGIVDPEEAYVDSAIMIKGDISSSSQPHVMAMMLEALDVKRGMKVLEIGTASGYNAALLSEITGRDSLVYSIEVEADLAQRAGRILQETGYHGVTVVAGDGRKGYPVEAPFDRIIVTAKADRIYDELLSQLDDDGILLTPFDFFGLMTGILKLFPQGGERYRGPLVGFPVSFVPIRGADVEERVNHRMLDSYYHLMQLVQRRRLELNQWEIAGLLVLMIHYCTQGKLEQYSDYENLLEHWETADRPVINDYEFEYDREEKDWHLIPVF